MNLSVIKSESDVKEALEEVLKLSESLDCVMIVALDKDDMQHLWTSTASGYKKAYLAQFLQAWMCKWFRIDEA